MSAGLALEVRPIFQKKFLGECVVKQSVPRSNTEGTSPVNHGSRIRRRITLLVFGLLVVAAAFWAYRVMAPFKMAADDREYSTYTLHLADGTHSVSVASTSKGQDEVISLLVTSSWAKGVPKRWRPAYPGATSIRWTATVDCSARKWTSLNHDTYGNVEGSVSLGVFTDYGPVKRTFEDTVWAGKVLVLKHVCEVDSRDAS